MKLIAIAALILGVLPVLPAQACERYVPVDNAEAERVMRFIQDTSKSEFERALAFETLVCADQPFIRDFAKREGMKTSSPGPYRHRVLWAILTQKQNLVIELGDLSVAEGRARQQYEELDGALVIPHVAVDWKQGCISTNANNRCQKGYRIDVAGDRVEIRHGYWFGVLTLQPDNVLRGDIRLRDYPRIAAKIELF